MADGSPSPREYGRYSRGYLPHLRVPGRPYFVTFRLEGTLPSEILHQYERERTDLLRRIEKDGNPCWAERKRLLELFSEKIESYLDAGRGECWLAKPAIAELVSGAFRFFNQQRYDLGAWVIMPNHIHVIVRPIGEHLLDEIVKSWKGYTAREANKLLSRTGESFWAREYYDHVIRDDDEKSHVITYIQNNPVSAGLCRSPDEWIWSTAHKRWWPE